MRFFSIFCVVAGTTSIALAGRGPHLAIMRKRQSSPNPVSTAPDPVITPTDTNSTLDYAPGTLLPIDGCTGYATAGINDTVYTLLDAGCHWTLNDFFFVNPSLHRHHPQVIVGKSYCISPPENLYSGAWLPHKGCKKYHTVQVGDTCDSIATAIGDITIGDLRHWNSHLDCDNLLIGHAYCSWDGHHRHRHTVTIDTTITPTLSFTPAAIEETPTPTITITKTDPAPCTDGVTTPTPVAVSSPDDCDDDDQEDENDPTEASGDDEQCDEDNVDDDGKDNSDEGDEECDDDESDPQDDEDDSQDAEDCDDSSSS